MPLTPFLAGRAATVVARRGALGVRLALGVHLPGPAPVALGPPPRVQAPRGAAHRRRRLRAVRRRRVALLRPRGRPGVGHRDHRPGRGARARPVHADVAVAPRRPYAQRHAALRRGDRSRPRRVPDVPRDAPRAPRPARHHGVGPVGGDRGPERARPRAAVRVRARPRRVPTTPSCSVAGLVHDIGHRFGPDESHGVLGAAQVRRPARRPGGGPGRGARPRQALSRHHRRLVPVPPVDRQRAHPGGPGGALTPDEVAVFESSPYAEDAVALRRADDAAKVPGRAVAHARRWVPCAPASAAGPRRRRAARSRST